MYVMEVFVLESNFVHIELMDFMNLRQEKLTKCQEVPIRKSCEEMAG